MKAKAAAHHGATAGVLLMLSIMGGGVADARDRPNVVLMMTDDQGHGDLGFYGNPIIRTPHLDALAKESVRFASFYVSPVCAPTRASLMTGRYNYRTGVVDTYLGRAMMFADEVTIPEMLLGAGYRTGIFGKWHLGDNYPLRAMDQGFEESLVHMGGGIGQPADPPGNTYFDPVLSHNGKAVKTQGYCSDVFTNAAIDFIEAHRTDPFFVYLSYNCPHTPLQVPASYEGPYQKADLSRNAFPSVGHGLSKNLDRKVTAKVYGMITNIDDNVGRLLGKLDELNLSEETIVVFLTDNGPQQPRYNSGMLQRKGSVHEGGIRVPCFVRWRGTFEAGREIDRIAAHIDIAPTLLALCGVDKPAEVAFDGVSLAPLLRGQQMDWPDRTLFFQWHRGDKPELFRAMAVRSQRYKLVQPVGAGRTAKPADPKFELYDMAADPLEQADIASGHGDVVARMRKQYEKWMKDVSATRGYAPPRIHLGTIHENPVTLTRQDWRGPDAGWGAESLGYWEVYVAKTGTYDVTLRFDEIPEQSTVHFSLRQISLEQKVSAGAHQSTFKGVELTRGPGRLEAWVDSGKERGKERVGVRYVDVKRAE